MKNIFDMDTLPDKFWVVLQHQSGDLYRCWDIALKLEDWEREDRTNYCLPSARLTRIGDRHLLRRMKEKRKFSTAIRFGVHDAAIFGTNKKHKAEFAREEKRHTVLFKRVARKGQKSKYVLQERSV